MPALCMVQTSAIPPSSALHVLRRFAAAALSASRCAHRPQARRCVRSDCRYRQWPAPQSATKSERNCLLSPVCAQSALSFSRPHAAGQGETKATAAKPAAAAPKVRPCAHTCCISYVLFGQTFQERLAALKEQAVLGGGKDRIAAQHKKGALVALRMLPIWQQLDIRFLIARRQADGPRAHFAAGGRGLVRRVRPAGGAPLRRLRHGQAKGAVSFCSVCSGQQLRASLQIHALR